MGITHLSGLEVAGVPTMGVAGVPGLYTGNWWFVNETTGSDGNTGASDNPFKTLNQALTMAQANNNDVVAFEGTIHLTSTLVWNKNQVHLIGMCAPLMKGKRARISVSGSTAFTPMVSVTASGCHFNRFGTFYGFNSSTNNVQPWADTGGRNCYDLVEFLGFGDGTATTGTANKTTSRSLTLNTSTGETTFRNCVFGEDTESRGAANYNIEIAGGAPRLTFENCDIYGLIAAGGTGGGFLLIGAAGIDRYVNFKNCRFISDTKSSGSTLTQAFNLNASIGGLVMLDQCTMVGVTHIETAPTNQVFLTNAAPSIAADAGIATNNHSS